MQVTPPGLYTSLLRTTAPPALIAHHRFLGRFLSPPLWSKWVSALYHNPQRRPLFSSRNLLEKRNVSCSVQPATQQWSPLYSTRKSRETPRILCCFSVFKWKRERKKERKTEGDKKTVQSQFSLFWKALRSRFRREQQQWVMKLQRGSTVGRISPECSQLDKEACLRPQQMFSYYFPSVRINYITLLTKCFNKNEKKHLNTHTASIVLQH